MKSVIPECSYRESIGNMAGFPITTLGNDVLFEIICFNSNTLNSYSSESRVVFVAFASRHSRGNDGAEDFLKSTLSTKPSEFGISYWPCNGNIDPMLIPPFLWSNKNTIYQHGKVEMVAASHTAGT